MVISVSAPWRIRRQLYTKYKVKSRESDGSFTINSMSTTYYAKGCYKLLGRKKWDC